MISIIVERSPGDNQGPDIVDSLIASDVQAIERGRIEVDRQCTNRMIVSGSCPMRSYMEPGKLIQVSDLEQGNYVAMLRSYSFDIRIGAGDFSATTSVVLEKSLPARG